MPDASPRNASLRWAALWLATLALTIAVYWLGLDGDFVFDDHPNIVRNTLVHIDSLAPGNLWQAWNASGFRFPNSRPLAMLSFGINHAVSGLSPFAFKATNLALHLVTGIVLYAVARRLAALFLRTEGRDGAQDAARWWAWLTAALWLLHPLNLSPVLLSVQRMSILSTLAVLLGMLFYLVGRRRLMDGERGAFAWILISPVFAVIGLLSKESALLLTALLFVTEWTLLRFRGLGPRPKRQLAVFFVVVAAVPILAAAVYFATHPWYLSFNGRPFDMTERALTQARVLWFYVQLLVAPDISAMGLFHDDIAVSRNLLQPWTTLVAVVALAATAFAAVLFRKRLPLLSFAVLFFLAGHALESSVFPLELVYEHRNYLPAIAPLFALAYLPTAGASALPVSRGLLNLLVAAVLLALSASTAMRAYDWSGFGRLIVAEVENHPDSPRANFQFAQLLMEQIQRSELSAQAADLAKQHLEHMTAANPDHADGLFGLVVLELYQGRSPPQALIDRLAERLRRLPFGPLNINSTQFAYLATWHDPARKLPGLTREQMLQIFEAALGNPTLPPMGRAAIHHALGGYAQYTLRDYDLALRSARLAVQAVPDSWEVLDRLVRLLAILGRFDEAESVLRSAIATDRAALYEAEAGDLADAIAAARRGEKIPSWSPKKKRRFGFDESTR